MGDRLVALDGRSLIDVQDLSRLLIRRQIGDTVQLTIQRNKVEMVLTVELKVF